MTKLETRLLAAALRLYPRRFRDRFAADVAATHRAWAERDPAAARRLLLDLLRNAPGCHLDALRLAGGRRRIHPHSEEASMFDSLRRDLAYATRRLRRAPVVTLLAAATLALGIGGTTAIFSLIHGVLLHPLSAPDAGRLVAVSEVDAKGREIGLSYENLLDYRGTLRSLSSLAATRPQSVAVTGGGEAPERIRGQFVTASYFDVLGEGPRLGRAIAPGEDVPGGARTAVLSHGFWQRRFGGDPAVLGRHLQLNNEDHVIVGVMGPDFRFPFDTTEAWISLQTYPGTLDRANRSVFGVGRLADGVSLAEANEELAVVARRLAAAHPEVNAEVGAVAASLIDRLTGSRTRNLLAVLVAAVTMVLLIGAANVANLQLAQATGRVREMAIRTAVGAGPGRLRAQLLIENLLLASAGGALGVGVAYGFIRLMTERGPDWVGGLYAIAPNPAVLLFAVVVSIVTGFAFGLAPARRAARLDLVQGLQEGAPRHGAGRAAGRLRASLVAAQMALAVMLVIAAGLLLRSLENLSQVDVGFDKDHLLQVQFRLPNNKYSTDEQVSLFFQQMIDRVAAVPGVRGVATGLGMPFTGDEGQVTVRADGVDAATPPAELPSLRANVVSRDYFEVLGIPLVAGRTFGDDDRAGGVQVAVISAEAARRIWPGSEPREVVGRAFSVDGGPGGEQRLEVAGVVGDIYNRGFRGGVDPLVYADHRQTPHRFATLAARVEGDPHDYANAIRAAIWELDPDQPLWEVMSQEERIALWTGSERFVTFLLSLFALVALTLAAIGLGGVVSYSVALRRHEVGVRMSLGATRGQIVRLILVQGLGMVSIGLAIGLAGAVALRGALAGFLYGVGRLDPAVFAATPLLLALVALLATLGPAWRAAWVDPVRTLREE